MEIKINIDDDKLNDMVMEKIADDIYYIMKHEEGLDEKKLLKKINWNKVSPKIGEFIMQKFFTDLFERMK